ncbi:ArsR/SmtB family transcription factor [Couchioplanes caeruleus]|uniref:Transcriptional regulator n=2 Tax=Couchioplanes caeruleus TaxID=56438 RepID=A0A1K0FSS4_9ACTN|nr:transcriptional regulator [Couchioplanes caeruleus subsp. caeruleus]ROP28467.1 ArsR family transcriptional regulator [Couchioplanes caeruleus]
MSVLPVLETTAAQGCCPPLSVQALAPQVAGELAPLFKALSDPIRLRLLSLIASSEEVCVCDLTGAFDVTGATISHHLRVLREAGMVEARRDGTWAYYRLRPEALDLLGGLLSADAAAAPRLSATAATPTTADVDVEGAAISANPDVVRLLADPLRAQLVQILATGPATTSHLVADTGAKQPNISGHLKLLREAGVVTTESRGRYTYYRLAPDALQGAALHLADLAAQARTTADDFRAL